MESNDRNLKITLITVLHVVLDLLFKVIVVEMGFICKYLEFLL